VNTTRLFFDNLYETCRAPAPLGKDFTPAWRDEADIFILNYIHRWTEERRAGVFNVRFVVGRVARDALLRKLYVILARLTFILDRLSEMPQWCWREVRCSDARSYFVYFENVALELEGW